MTELLRAAAPAVAVLLACALAPAAAAATATTTPSGAPATSAAGPPVYTLDGLIRIARGDNPLLAAERARVDIARAGVTSAAARPNPEFELAAGSQRGRAGSPSGTSALFGVLQPIDRAGLRLARIGAAEAAVDAAAADAGAWERDLVAAVKLRYFEVLRLQAASRLADEDLDLAEQIRARVQVRVGTGEAPRFELIRAEAERLNALRAAQAAASRIDAARAELRRLVGPGLPTEFEVAGSIEEAPSPPPELGALRAAMLASHPQLRAARAALRAAQARVGLERERARPSFALRGSVDRVPDSADARIGLVVQLPVFDRREGPIAEAQLEAERERLRIADLELALTQSLEAAWQRYQIALAEVAAYESGILREAEAALRVAESAYRFGERGILDYLDARRTFRTARDELNATRYDLRAALVELERLRGAESE